MSTREGEAPKRCQFWRCKKPAAGRIRIHGDSIHACALRGSGGDVAVVCKEHGEWAIAHDGGNWKWE